MAEGETPHEPIIGRAKVPQQRETRAPIVMPMSYDSLVDLAELDRIDLADYLTKLGEIKPKFKESAEEKKGFGRLMSKVFRGPPSFTEIESSPETIPLPEVTGVATAVSERHPERNDDVSLVTEDAAGIFDGNSKPEGGQIAAELTKRVCKLRLGSMPQFESAREVQKYLAETLVLSDRVIRLYRAMHNLEDIGTTAAFGVFWTHPETGITLFIGAKTGDSVFRKLDKNQQLKRLTNDFFYKDVIYKKHGWDQASFVKAQEALDNGGYHPEVYAHENFKQDRDYEAITKLVYESNQVIGLGNLEAWPLGCIETFAEKFEEGDTLVATSDGVKLTNKEFETILTSDLPPQEQAEQAVQLARNNAPSDDAQDDKAIVIRKYITKKAIGRASVPVSA